MWILFQGGEIFALHIDGTGLWQVSVPKPNTGMYLGGWSPDGTRILYTEAVDLNVNTSFPLITTLHPLGKQKVFKWERVKVPRIPLDTVRWGADGKSILFSAQKGRHWHIYRFRLDTHQLTQLTDSIGADRSPHEWNPRLSVQPQQLLPLFWGRLNLTDYGAEVMCQRSAYLQDVFSGITLFFTGMIPPLCAHKSISSQTASPAAAEQFPSIQA